MNCLNEEIVAIFRALGRNAIQPSVLERDLESRFEEGIWRQISEAGLFSMGRDSLGLDLRKLASAYYGLAMDSLDLPLVCTFAAHGVIARDLLIRFGTDGQKEKYLALMESGALRGAICNSEPGASSDLRRVKAECVVSSNGRANLKFRKPCVTNGHLGSLYFVSAWEKSEGSAPQIAVYLLEAHEVEAGNLGKELSSFRTGLTGSVSAEINDFPFQERRLRGSAFAVFKHLFHMERLFIGVIAAGVLQGMENKVRNLLEERSKKMSVAETPQWILEKVTTLVSTRLKIEALADQVLQSCDFEAKGKELAVLKLTVNEGGVESALAFLELFGHSSIKQTHPAQKLLRDFTAFKFFGGTSELQKLSLCQEVMGASSSEPNTKKEKVA